MELYFALMASDGQMRSFMEGLQGEALSVGYQTIYKTSLVPRFLHSPLAWFLREVLGEKRKAGLLDNVYQRSAFEYWELCKDVQE